MEIFISLILRYYFYIFVLLLIERERLTDKEFIIMAQKPSVPKGTRDFNPTETARRNYIFDTIRQVFNLYGFQPIETPAMENLSTLMGKYGAEGDKLLFKVLNSGDFASKVQDEDWNQKDSQKLVNHLSEKGLRYDLTVPFARFVVQHRNEISFPFKRYQIQPVWRADKPQKGRYREFYQCDIDVVGTNSLLSELEIIQIVEEVYKRLNLDVVLKINNRKILAGIAESIGHEDLLIDITVAIDKLDKMPLEKVINELKEKGLENSAIEQITPIITHIGNTEEKIALLKKQLSNSKTGMKGIEEIEAVFKFINVGKVDLDVELDLSLARGLNYYTGAIFEVKSKEMEIGSITGGGRYDNLTEIFGLKDVSGVGISFGADRIYDVLSQTNKFPANNQEQTKLMFVNFGGETIASTLSILRDVRGAGINAEIYPTNQKMKKQFSYANQKQIRYVAVAGDDELKQGKVQLKNMKTGEQQLVDSQELIEILTNTLK